MHLQYRLASLVICRSGATTIAEITAAGRVSALIPFPYAANNHQEHNARIIETANAGEVILDNEISGERLAKSITRAMDDPENLQKMEDNSYQLGSRDATEKVRQLCEDLMKNEKNKSKSNNLSKKIMSCF